MTLHRWLPIRLLPCGLAMLLATACGSAHTPSTATSGPAAEAQAAVTPVDLAPHYAPLFEERRAWQYSATFTESFWDDGDPQADDDGMVHDEQTWTFACRVADVEHRPDLSTSRIECDQDDGGLVAGWYAADEAGLYALSEPLPAGATIAEHAVDGPLIAASPEAHSDSWEDELGMGGSSDVSNDGGRWCVEQSHFAGDESWSVTCFGPGLGITYADSGWAGGAMQETTVRLVD